jgi:hypothetical protein
MSLGLLGASALVVWGVPLALHVLAGNSATANTRLCANIYEAAFDGLRTWDGALPLLEVTDPVEVLEGMALVPDLGKGPEALMAESQALLTLGGLVGVLKGIVSIATALLAFCSMVPPTVPTCKLTGDEGWGGCDDVREHVGLPSSVQAKLAVVAAFARKRSLALTTTITSSSSSSSSSSSNPVAAPASDANTDHVAAV